MKNISGYEQFQMALTEVISIILLTYMFLPWNGIWEYHISFLRIIFSISGISNPEWQYYGKTEDIYFLYLLTKLFSIFGILTAYILFFRLSRKTLKLQFFKNSSWSDSGINWSISSVIEHIHQFYIKYRSQSVVITDNRLSVAEYIRSNRKKSFMTQQHLADACAISLKTIQRSEKTGSISDENLRSVCAVLNIRLPEIEVNPEITILTLFSDLFLSFSIERRRAVVMMASSIITSIILCLIMLTFFKDYLKYDSIFFEVIGISCLPFAFTSLIIIGNLFIKPKDRFIFRIGGISFTIASVPFMISLLFFYNVTSLSNDRNRNIQLLSMENTYQRLFLISDVINNKNDSFIVDSYSDMLRTEISSPDNGEYIKEFNQKAIFSEQIKYVINVKIEKCKKDKEFAIINKRPIDYLDKKICFHYDDNQQYRKELDKEVDKIIDRMEHILQVLESKRKS